MASSRALGRRLRLWRNEGVARMSVAGQLELAESPLESPGVRARVLVVEDDPESTESLRELLASHYEVSSAKNGQEALERTRKEMPDLIVSDVLMPELGGIEVFQELLSDPRTEDI